MFNFVVLRHQISCDDHVNWFDDDCILIIFFQIANVLDCYAATLTKRSDHDVFFMTTQGIAQLVQRYVIYVY